MPTPSLKDSYPYYFIFMEEERKRKEEEQSSLPYQKRTMEILKNIIQGKGFFHQAANR